MTLNEDYLDKITKDDIDIENDDRDIYETDVPVPVPGKYDHALLVLFDPWVDGLVIKENGGGTAADLHCTSQTLTTDVWVKLNERIRNAMDTVSFISDYALGFMCHWHEHWPEWYNVDGYPFGIDEDMEPEVQLGKKEMMGNLTAQIMFTFKYPAPELVERFLCILSNVKAADIGVKSIKPSICDKNRAIIDEKIPNRTWSIDPFFFRSMTGYRKDKESGQTKYLGYTGNKKYEPVKTLLDLWWKDEVPDRFERFLKFRNYNFRYPSEMRQSYVFGVSGGARLNSYENLTCERLGLLYDTKVFPEYFPFTSITYCDQSKIGYGTMQVYGTDKTSWERDKLKSYFLNSPDLRMSIYMYRGERCKSNQIALLFSNTFYHYYGFEQTVVCKWVFDKDKKAVNEAIFTAMKLMALNPEMLSGEDILYEFQDFFWKLDKVVIVPIEQALDALVFKKKFDSEDEDIRGLA